MFVKLPQPDEPYETSLHDLLFRLLRESPPSFARLISKLPPRPITLPHYTARISPHFLDEVNSFGTTILLETFRIGNLALALLLVEKGADPWWEGELGCSEDLSEGAIAFAKKSNPDLDWKILEEEEIKMKYSWARNKYYQIRMLLFLSVGRRD
jgi:hypothetical protein